jgi:Ser/Thr protein kinase RdoA (MazF antagonist)
MPLFEKAIPIKAEEI